MLKDINPKNIEELALLSSSALDAAIFNLNCGNEELCLKTLQSLHLLLCDIAGLKPARVLKLN